MKDWFNRVAGTVINIAMILGFIAFVLFLFWLDKVRFIF